MKRAELKPHHGNATESARLLQRAGAPDDLVAAVDGRGLDVVWDECFRGDWLIWLAAVEGVPVVALVEAAMTCARRCLQTVPKGKERKAMTAALRAVKELRSSVICAKRADACDAIAGKIAPAVYRTPPTSPKQRAASACGAAARAAEALLVAEARRVGERDREERQRAASLGLTPFIVRKGHFAPLLFDARDELMRMCVGSAETAIVETRLALAPPAASVEVLEGIDGELANAVFKILDPIRNGLRSGTPPEELVRSLVVQIFRDHPLEKREKPDDLEKAIPDNKRPLYAVALGLCMPIGGLGHHYAGHHTTGWLLTVGGFTALCAMAAHTGSIAAWLMIVACDVALAPAAIRRHNADAHASALRQAAVGFAILLAALIAGSFL